MKQILNNELEDSKSSEVICIGEALLDRLGPPGGDPLLDKPFEDRLGGAPANVACGLAKLGTKAAFCGRLGDDSIGESFIELFCNRGVDLHGLQIDPERPSRVVLVRRDLKGERSFQGFLGDTGEGFADQALSVNDLRDVWSSLTRNARWLLAGTIPLATKKSEEAFLWSLDNALENNIQIVIDINWRSKFWNSNHPPDIGPNERELVKIIPVLEKASLIKLAKEEAIWFFNSDDPWKISKSLLRQPDVVVTDGSSPLHWLIGGFSGEMEAMSPRSVVDTTGAGDAFTAGLLYKLLKLSSKPVNAMEAEEVVRFAAACGALVCGGTGGIDPQPTDQEVIAFLLGAFGGEK